ncbi:hypothetical protein Cni_G19379 [Canna indica]|uniref:Uncharacterized protein n=1 Tax=Canna indica TaxID=4628 RepID=A0AAQ3QJP0_9LILI|nr:hypothetical protein Cni_G19379 [Canna indica]
MEDLTYKRKPSMLRNLSLASTPAKISSTNPHQHGTLIGIGEKTRFISSTRLKKINLNYSYIIYIFISSTRLRKINLRRSRYFSSQIQLQGRREEKETIIFLPRSN